MKKFILFAFSLTVSCYGNNLLAQTGKSKSSKKQSAPSTTPAPVNAGDVKSGDNNKKVDIGNGAGTTPSPQEIKPKGNANTTANETSANLESFLNELEKYMEPVVEQKPNGQINWTEQYVEAKGQSVIDTVKFKNKAQAKLMAVRGAVVVAQRNLLEMVKGVNVVGESTVQDMITMNDYVYTRVEGVVKGAQQVGGARETDGYMEVTMRMPIYGNKGIAGTFGEAELNAMKLKLGIKEMTAVANEPNLNAKGDDVVDGSRPFVFNFKGKQIDPSMFPVIVDDNGNIQLDFSKWYDPNSGKFPKYMQLGKEVLQDVGFQKGVDVIDLVQNAKGQFTIPQENKKKVVWQKIGNVAQKIGKVLFSILT
jgi:hypothetical protein